MSDLTAIIHLEEIKDILRQFGLDIKVTHVNKMYCDDERKHFFGMHEGEHCDINFFRGGKCAHMNWYIEGFGSIRKEHISFNRAGVMESHGNMVYVGEEA